ncbi:hypothetical protein [Xenorhabdus taiwanensis]|uniref:Transglutaminase-like domain-containing protein n=1 Tax=Xenorhabdus taiwanensis TaxID=3085177 RepID=A0ABN7C0H2_9GAMM|nr:hypothetical protein TCT1_08000 [Xenorhabdus sp. TCT-1]
MSLPYNLFLARRAINYVNIQIGIISPNKLPYQTLEQQYERNRCNFELLNTRIAIQERLRQVVDEIPSDSFYRKHALLSNVTTIESHLGNCGEKAILAFSHLKMLGARPLDLFDINIDNRSEDAHTIVVIGRITGHETDPKTWNHESVVCDPWDNQIYPISLYDSKIPFRGGLILHYRYV